MFVFWGFFRSQLLELFSPTFPPLSAASLGSWQQRLLHVHLLGREEAQITHQHSASPPHQIGAPPTSEPPAVGCNGRFIVVVYMQLP